MADQDRRLTLKLNLVPDLTAPGGVQQAFSRLSQEGAKVERSLNASQQILKGMRAAAIDALPAVTKAPEPLTALKAPPSFLQGLGQMMGGIGGGRGMLGGILGAFSGASGGAGISGAVGALAGGAGGAALASTGPAGLILTAAVAAVNFGAKVVSSGLNNLNQMMKELAGTLGAGGSLMVGTSNALKAIPLVGEALGGMVDSMKGLLETGVQAAGLYSPGTTERAQLVGQDTMATVGRMFVPIVEGLTEFTRLVGDFLATILPGTAQMRDALTPLRMIFGSMRSVLQDFAPLIQFGVVIGLQMLKDALMFLAVGLQITLGPLRALAGVLFGIGGGGALNSSAGMAAHNISFASADQAAKQVYQAAYRAGAPDQADYLGSIAGNMQKLLDGFEGGLFEIGMKAIGQAIGAAGETVAGSSTLQGAAAGYGGGGLPGMLWGAAVGSAQDIIRAAS